MRPDTPWGSPDAPSRCLPRPGAARPSWCSTRPAASSTGTLALDDFGTGFGAFTYLSRLTVTELKIDRAFVVRVRHSASDRRVVASMIAVAHNFEMRTVAEGIEDIETLRTLTEMGVDLAQGFLLGRPEPIHARWDSGR